MGAEYFKPFTKVRVESCPETQVVARKGTEEESPWEM